MNELKINKVKIEMERLQNRINELEIEIDKHGGNFSYWIYPKQTGAVKRASVDLTRALAELRKSN